MWKARTLVAGVTLAAAGALIVLMLAVADSIDAVTPEPSRRGAGAVETPGGACLLVGYSDQASVEQAVRDHDLRRSERPPTGRSESLP